MSEQSKYEQARDEAANKLYDDSDVEYMDCNIDFFKAGSDFGRSYTAVEYANTMILNSDLLADCKLMREALKFYSLKSNYSLIDEGRNYGVDYKCYELNETTYADEELGTKAKEILAKLKGKYDD